MKTQEEAVAQIADIAEMAFRDALEILQIIQLMQSQNSGNVNDNLSAAELAWAGIAIRNSLVSRLVILSARCYSPTRDGDLHLRQAIDLLSDAGVKAALASRSSEGAVD